MNRRASLLTLLLSLTILVSLTMACTIPGLPGGGAVDTPAAPPGEEPPVTEPTCGDGVCEGPENAQTCPQDCGAPEEDTPAPPPPEEELPFDMDMDALEGLSSYGWSLHVDGLSTMEGVTEEIVVDIEGQRQSEPTKAEQLKFSATSDGETEAMEVIYIEDGPKMWMRESDGAWQEIPPEMHDALLGMFTAFSMTYWWDAIFAADPADAQYVGQEVVNGVPSHHYQNAEAAGLGAFTVGCTFAAVEDNIWVAVDGGFPVKREWSGQADCQGESGSFNFRMEIRDVNQPLNIQPPV